MEPALSPGVDFERLPVAAILLAGRTEDKTRVRLVPVSALRDLVGLELTNQIDKALDRCLQELLSFVRSRLCRIAENATVCQRTPVGHHP